MNQIDMYVPREFKNSGLSEMIVHPSDVAIFGAVQSKIWTFFMAFYQHWDLLCDELFRKKKKKVLLQWRDFFLFPRLKVFTLNIEESYQTCLKI